MKYKLQFTFFLLLVAFGMRAQTWTTDTIHTNLGYTLDNFYSLADGDTVSTSTNVDWDIAFYVNASGQNSFSASVMANHSQPAMPPALGMMVYSAHKSAADWTSISIADTAGLLPAFNSTESYDIGAFNQNKNAANVFDFGWGVYNSSNHNLYGDSIYIIAKGPNYYKMIIDSLDGSNSTWYFRIANINGTNEQSVIVNNGGAYSTKVYAYYDIETNAILDREPDMGTWDINFSMHTPLVEFMGQTLRYPLAGPLAHRNHLLSVLAETDPNTATENMASDASFENNYSLMAWKWRKPGTNDTVGNLSYFLKPYNDTMSIYQIVYSYIGGFSNGTYIFSYRKFKNVLSVKSKEGILTEYTIFPMPSSIGEVFVSLASAQNLENIKCQLLDISGRLIYEQNYGHLGTQATIQIPTAQLLSGHYILQLTSEDQQLLSQVVSIQN